MKPKRKNTKSNTKVKIIPWNKGKTSKQKKACAVCTKEFLPSDKEHIFCSLSCLAKHRATIYPQHGKYNGMYTHGMTRTPFYSRWILMKHRCNNPKDKAYNRYGGRGIKIEWKTFEDFYRDMYPSFKRHVKKYGLKNTSIDRIDNNGNYSKQNCRWATMDEQGRNTRKNVYFIYKGKNYRANELSKKFNLSVSHFSNIYEKFGVIKKKLYEQ